MTQKKYCTAEKAMNARPTDQAGMSFTSVATDVLLSKSRSCEVVRMSFSYPFKRLGPILAPTQLLRLREFAR